MSTMNKSVLDCFQVDTCLISTIVHLEEGISIVAIRMIQVVKTRGCKDSVGFRQAF